MIESDKRVLVQSLVGGTQIDFYIRCLLSLITQCKEPIQLLLHSDGSVSQLDREKILEGLGGINVSFPNPSETKEETLDQLKGRPYCQNIRNDSIWGIEFFDPIFSDLQDDISFYIDADILFFQPFAGLFDRHAVKGGGIFLSDLQWDAYCLRPWELIGSQPKPEVVKGITTGLVFWDKNVIDWDYLEWFLGAHHLHHIPEWIMPTAQACLANRCQSKTVCPKQIRNLYPNAKITPQTFGLHLLGSYREQWLKALPDEAHQSGEKMNPQNTIFQPCQKQGIFGYTARQTKRWINTRLNIW